jgi:hypothetical protein
MKTLLILGGCYSTSSLVATHHTIWHTTNSELELLAVSHTGDIPTNLQSWARNPTNISDTVSTTRNFNSSPRVLTYILFQLL